MRAVVQRVSRAVVSSEETQAGSIDGGLVVLLGVGEGDSEPDGDYIAEKCANLRIFEDENDKLNLSVLDVGGSVLLISQFTLYGDARKGRRPGFSKAAKPDEADRLYLYVKKRLEELGLNVQTGVFRTHMAVELVNDGPVTILLDSGREF